MPLTEFKAWLSTQLKKTSFRLLLPLTALVLAYLVIQYLPANAKVRGMVVVDRPVESMHMGKTGNHLFYGGHYVKLYYSVDGKDYKRRIFLGTGEQHQKLVRRLKSGQNTVWVAYPTYMPWRGNIISF
jgi:hypothetical protein